MATTLPTPTAPATIVPGSVASSTVINAINNTLYNNSLGVYNQIDTVGLDTSDIKDGAVTVSKLKTSFSSAVLRGAGDRNITGSTGVYREVSDVWTISTPAGTGSFGILFNYTVSHRITTGIATNFKFRIRRALDEDFTSSPTTLDNVDFYQGWSPSGGSGNMSTILGVDNTANAGTTYYYRLEASLDTGVNGTVFSNTSGVRSTRSYQILGKI